MFELIKSLWIFDEYTALQWALFFMFYCIFGWAFESVYCSLKELRFLNRGFCHGPWLPIYGVGAVLMLMFAWPYRGDLRLVYVMGVIVGTGLEFVTGFTMFHIFHMKWWDYSHNPFNFHGYICLYASLAWGFLAVFFTRVMHPHVAEISANWTYTGFVVAVTMLYTLFIEDLIFSVIGALDLKRRLEQLAENSEEIQTLKLNITEARARLLELQEQARANVSEVKNIAETEGNLAAAKVVTEETRRVIATGSTFVANTIKTGSVTAAKAAVKTVADAGTATGKTVINVGSTAGRTMIDAGVTVIDAGTTAGKSVVDAGKAVAGAGANAGKSVLETGKAVAGAGANAGKSVIETGKAVAGAGANAGKSVVSVGKSAARRVASAVPGTRSNAIRQSNNKEGLEQHRRRMEERLHILEDGGDAHSGRMNWWVRTMLSNNPTHNGHSETFNKLRESAKRYSESFEKLEARIDAEYEKLQDEYIDEMDM